MGISPKPMTRLRKVIGLAARREVAVGRAGAWGAAAGGGMTGEDAGEEGLLTRDRWTGGRGFPVAGRGYEQPLIAACRSAEEFRVVEAYTPDLPTRHAEVF